MDFIAEILLTSPATLDADGVTYACTIGRGGIRADKAEGDLATPVGTFKLRECFYRPDRLSAPQTGLKLVPLTPKDGWCDDPSDPLYNQHITLPFTARHENLWREDSIYDLIIPLGYNDGPIIPGKGSAIFLHLMRPDGVGTEGCIAVARETLLALLPRLGPETVLRVPAEWA